jgi:predicted transcriptional regulator
MGSTEKTSNFFNVPFSYGFVMANYLKEIGLIRIPLQKKYRSYIEIVALILEAVKYGDAGLYFIMKQTNINYPQLKKYLKPLSRLGFVEPSVRDGKAFFRASEKGLAFLKQYNVLRDMLSNADFESNRLQYCLQKVKRQNA